MAALSQEPTSTQPSVKKRDTDVLLREVHNESQSSIQERESHHARTLSSRSVLADGLVDLLVVIPSFYFLVFAVIVYRRDGQALDEPGNRDLLEAARYTPTLFPIVFAAIVAKFLRAFAAIKLEHGASVMTLESILYSRTVFSALTAPVALGAIHIFTPFLVILWALSPLGGQAGLRVIYTEDQHEGTPNNFTYLAFNSPFTNQGPTSASANLLIPINALFTSALIAADKTKLSAQDQFTNVRIPLYANLTSPTDPSSEWRTIEGLDEVSWSSLIGLPIDDLPTSGASNFTMSTGYMVADCQVVGLDWNHTYPRSLNVFNGWSGANYAISPGTIMQYAPANFTFRSLDTFPNASADGSKKALTEANCTVSMQYVDARIQCNGQTCACTGVRQAVSPATHKPNWASTTLNDTFYTPMNGLAQPGIMQLSFLPDLTNATNPTVGCDTTTCPPALIEAYLVNPENPLLEGNTQEIWRIGNDLFSQRFTQILNTYWIASVAPYLVSGTEFNLTAVANSLNYNVDSDVGTITQTQTVIRCDKRWLAIMLICSLVLITAGFTTLVLKASRRGPDILDRFSSLLRGNPYVKVSHKSSMEDAIDMARRLRHTTVRLGDVKADDGVGYVAIGTLDGGNAVQRLTTRRRYA